MRTFDVPIAWWCVAEWSVDRVIAGCSHGSVQVLLILVVWCVGYYVVFYCVGIGVFPLFPPMCV